MYFLFNFWFIYLVGCEIIYCIMYGYVFYILKIFGLVMFGVFFVIVVVESFFFCELKYFKNVMDENEEMYIKCM